MPIDKRKLDSLLDEIAILEKNIDSRKRTKRRPRLTSATHSLSPLKQPELLETEKMLYFQFCHYFKLTMLSIEHTEVALEIWIKGVLPHLLSLYNMENEEWERLCAIGDTDSQIQKELEDDWVTFFREIVEKGRIEEEILTLIDEGKKKKEYRTRTD
jgi:hypothetical protein